MNEQISLGSDARSKMAEALRTVAAALESGAEHVGGSLLLDVEPDEVLVLQADLRLRPPLGAAKSRTIDHVTEAFIFASSGYVNTCRPGQLRNSQHPYETATVTLNVGQRMIVERVDQGRMRLEVLPCP